MKQRIDGSLNHFWKISYGQIYPALKLLVDQGYARVKDTAQEGKPDKKEYEITPEGIEALKRWLAQPITELPVEKNELLLKLFLADIKIWNRRSTIWRAIMKNSVNAMIRMKRSKR
ncbi:PadR family transcriptional regulator [Planomicrobium sp. CPCC 101110]|uniref:PadR family transcriptional regulator n=1 Tax=Planomicrobium sp. CPCC 101110 TaxID=2599619 RepID=UPI00351B385D